MSRATALTWIGGLAGLFVALASPSMAQPPSGGPPFGGGGRFSGGRPSAEQFFGRFDKNKDGKISKAEAPEFLWQRLSRDDANGDGLVSREEFKARRGGPPRDAAASDSATRPSTKGPSSTAGEATLAALGARGDVTLPKLREYWSQFKSVDANGDGKHSRKEYVSDGKYLNEKSRAGIFKAADRDGDGFVSQREYVENRIITDEAKSIFDRIADGKKLTREQFVKRAGVKNQSQAKAIFARLDTDGDGTLQMIEYLRVWGDLARVNAGRNRWR